MMTQYMPNPNGFPNSQVPQCRSRMALPPRGPCPQSFYCGPIHPNRPTNMPRSCSSDVLSEEPPAWFEDLLNEPESPVNNGHHRRSASDSSARVPVGGPPCNFQMPVHFFNGMPRGPSFQQQQIKLRISTSTCPKLPNGLINAKEDADCQALGMTCSPEPDRVKLARSGTETQGEDTSFTSNNNASRGGDSSHLKPAFASISDAKRKQHNARRSRVRKLQYIAELERNAQVLQAARAEVSKQLEFFDQQNLILGMENRALKQRLKSLSQEHYIKSMEQEMLDKELARLQYLYQMQQTMNPHQLQFHRQKQNHAVHRRGRSVNDIDPQLARLSLHPPLLLPAMAPFCKYS